MTYQPLPLRMKGAAASKRWMGPPQYWQVVRGGAEMRCLTSYTRSHCSHSYS